MKYIGFASTKGGVAKTTSAIHFAYWAATTKDLSTLLVDDDGNRTALKWASRSMENATFESPFAIAPYTKLARASQGKEMVVLDTQASISKEALQDLAEDCNLVIVPTKSDIDSLNGAVDTAMAIQEKGGDYRILITDCPPAPSKIAVEAQEALTSDGLMVIKQRIRRGAGIHHASLTGTTAAQQASKYRGPWWDYQKAFAEIYGLIENDE